MIIKYDIEVETEYHIGTGLEHPGVVDGVLVTRPDGSLVVPSEHFRGVVRDACTQILHWLNRTNECCEASLVKGSRQSTSEVLSTCGLTKDGECVLCRLFGTTFIPRYYEFFDSVPGETNLSHPRISVHNRVDPAIGRVPEETFFSFELGASSKFTGKIERDSPQTNPDMLLEEAGLLLAGLRAVERIGSRSRRGWGRCRVKITDITLFEGEEAPEIVKGTKEKDISSKVDAWLEAFILNNRRRHAPAMEIKKNEEGKG